MHKLIILIALLLCSCANGLTQEDIRQQEYGTMYATMECWWTTQPNSPALFWCNEELQTPLISGYVSLAVERDIDGEQFLSICGKEIILNSGHNIHDTLIASMTQHEYSCYDTYERSLGNEFDWIWIEDINTLQMIWRPEDEIHKVLTLYVPERLDSPNVTGSVYYKTGYFN